MKPEHLIGRDLTPDGAEVVLHVRDGVYTIRVDGRELMSSRSRGSEESLARLVLEEVGQRQPRVLVGGLGMGYTLRAVLDVQARSRVVVAELMPAIIEWNRTELGHLAGSPLDDSRVELVNEDVAKVIDSGKGTFDAILLDVDNGPSAFTVARNGRLYSPKGLAAVHRALRPRGVLGVWSAEAEPPFLRVLRRAGFKARAETVYARRVAKGHKDTIFVAERR